MGKAPLDHFAQLMARVAGGITMILGLGVLYGWHTSYVPLVQLAPTLTPMPYSSAVSFALSGMGLLALTFGRARLAAACGIVVAGIGSLTLGQYLFGFSLDLTPWFVDTSLAVQTPYPPRMGPNSALCLVLVGVTIVAMSQTTRLDRLLLLAGPVGAIVLALGLVAGIRYFTGLTTYREGYFTPISPQAALGYSVLGGGVIAYAWQVKSNAQAAVQRRFAVLVGVAVLTVTLGLWQALLASENALVERTTELAKASVQNEIMTQMQSRILSLIRMARLWEMQGRPSRDVWEADAELFVNHHPGMQALAWVDSSFHVQWLVPRDGNEAVQGLNFAGHDQRRSTMELAHNSRQVTATGMLDLVQGGRGFEMFVPIGARPQFDGFLVGTFRTSDLFDVILANAALRHAIAILEGAEEIYGRYDPSRQYEREWGQEAAVGLYGVTWRIRVWPTPALVAEQRSPFPEVVLAVGLSTGGLLVLALHLAFIARQRAAQVDLTNQALRNEIGDHQRTGALLADRIKQMEAVRAVTMEITRELDLTTLLRLITRRAIDLVEAAQSGAIFLWDDTAHALLPQAWHGRGEWMRQVRIHLGEGVVGTVAQRHEGLLVNDYQHSSYLQPRIVEHFRSSAIIAEPLLYRGQLVGVIVLDNRGTDRPFASEDRALLAFLAAQAAIAIENARLYKAMEGRFSRVQTLTRLNQLVSSSLDTHKVLNEIAGAAATLMDAAVVSFWFADEGSRTLEVQTFSDESIGGDFPERTLSFEQGGVGWVASHRRALNVPDVLADSRFVARDWYRAHRLRSFFGIPILHEDALIAVLSLNGLQPFSFTPDDQSLLDSFVAQAAVAIRNARLFAEIREQATHLTQLNAELQNEIGERERAERALQRQAGLVKLLQNAAVAANEAKTVEDAMQAVVNDVCAYTGWPIGHVYAVDNDVRGFLLPRNIWYLADTECFEAFRRATEVTRLAYGHGVSGRVVADGKAVWMTDVTTDADFPLASAARDIGVRAGFGFPVLVGTEVAAVLEFFSTEAVEPDQALLEVMAHVGTQIGRVVERQRGEEALRTSEVRFRSVVQAATDAIILGDGQGRIITWNRGAQAIFGYTEAEVLGKPLTMLMPARYRAAHQQGIKRLLGTGQARLAGKTLEYHGLRKDGREFPLEMSLVTWQASGSVFCSGIIRDTTERKHAMEQLQHQQEALYQREKLAAMGSLLASIAHELNNPLSVVMMQSDLLSLELRDEALAERIKVIGQSAERCVQIVRNFLALARQDLPQRASVSLNMVVEEALGLLAYALRVDDIAVERDLAADLPSLWADPHQLYQVVVNLISNAHHALRDSVPPRRLTLTTRYEAARHVISLEVTDTGPGIPPELQERIFEPFFTTKPPGVGTGLGLPFCKGIIEGHGGSISVRSLPGQGATFRLSLQVADAPPISPPATAATPVHAAEGRSILVIDDEPGIIGALAYLLRRDGHTVDTAANGRLALAKLQEHTYDLILCDLRMPELDGQGFYREVERSYPSLARRIIFLTGDMLSPDAREFLAKAGRWQLGKPFRAAEVRQAIQQALQAS